MKILVLGASGMIGSCIYRYLFTQNHTMRGTYYSKSRLKNNYKFKNIRKLDCTDFDEVSKFLLKCNADVIINCTGITKHTVSKKKDDLIFKLNSELPILLAKKSLEEKKRFIQIKQV